MMDANLESWSWAIDSMRNLRLSKVVFAAEAKDLIGGVTRPLLSIFSHSILRKSGLNSLISLVGS